MTTELKNKNRKLLADLKKALKDPYTFKHAVADFSITFDRLGMPLDLAGDIAMRVAFFISESGTLEESEERIKELFEKTIHEGKTLFAMIQDSLKERFEIIYDQIEPFMKNAGFTLDYGCGSGILTQMLNDRLSLDIEGVDVRDFRAEGVTVKLTHLNGCRTRVADKYYDCAVLTNVIHHEANNEEILRELDRIVRDKLVIIETVPEGATEEDAKKDWGRMLLNDALWNRFFNYADIPVPGTYETPDNWISRFAKYGWRCTRTKDLGFDQPTIQDRHHLLVFER